MSRLASSSLQAKEEERKLHPPTERWVDDSLIQLFVQSHPVSSFSLSLSSSDVWWQAYHNLLTGYQNTCLQLSVPCFVSSEPPRPGSQLENTAYRKEDILYLDVTAPAVRPGLVVISDSGRTIIDFSSVGTGRLNV